MTDAADRYPTTPARDDVEDVPAEDIEAETVEEPAWIEPDDLDEPDELDEPASATTTHNVPVPTSTSQRVSTPTTALPAGTAAGRTREPSSVVALLAPSPVLALVLTALGVLAAIVVVVGLLSLSGIV